MAEQDLPEPFNPVGKRQTAGKMDPYDPTGTSAQRRSLSAQDITNEGVDIAKGVGCTTCHGPVGTMALMRQAQSLTMGWCLNCHRDPTPYLREHSAVFDPEWKPSAQQEEDGKKRLIAYLIDNKHLTDCSTCHR